MVGELRLVDGVLDMGVDDESVCMLVVKGEVHVERLVLGVGDDTGVHHVVGDMVKIKIIYLLFYDTEM